jgi:tRNA(His) 5'-end guanylyltransferase
MPESYWNHPQNPTQAKSEIFSTLQVPQDTPFFVRLNGRRFQAVSEKLKAKKPFDKKFIKCLVASGKAIFQADFNPTLVYVASDEINVLFAYGAPFNRRVEKINSVLAGTVSSALSLNALKVFGKPLTVAFDSRIIIVPKEKSVEYLTWRQLDAWRNHNNAYAYWLLRKMRRSPKDAAQALRGIKTEQLNQLLFQHGINLAKTQAWQRRGVLVYKQPYQKLIQNHRVPRWRIRENWNLPIFSSNEGKTLVKQVLEWAKPHRKSEE